MPHKNKVDAAAYARLWRSRHPKPSTRKETDFEYLKRRLLEFSEDDPRAPWQNYPCVEWDRGEGPGGYGRVFYKGKNKKVHRLSFFIANNVELPPEIKACHHCDNRLCFRPVHIFSGTTMDNVRDKMRKGRQCQGETHGRAKVTEDQVREIRLLYAGGLSQDKIAVRFPVGQSVVSSIVRREIWDHVTD